MRKPSTLLALATLAACGSSATPVSSTMPPAAPAAPVAPATPPADAPPTGTTLDDGTFVLELQGSEIGREKFTLLKTADGFAIVTDSTLQVGAMSGSAQATLRTDPSWRPVDARLRVKAGSHDGLVLVHRGADGLVVVTTDAGGQEQKTQKPTDLLLGNNTIAHYAPFCTLPAGESGAKIVLPDTPVSYGPAVPLELGTRHVSTRELDFGATVHVRLYCEEGKLVGLDDTSDKLRAHRDGDAALAQVLAQKPREKPPTPATVVELARTVKAPAAAGVGDAVLDCTLLLPAAYAEVKDAKQAKGKTKPLPAVVFITGSGPEDRDEDSVGPGGLKLAIFKVMAIQLGEAGIASLRCDDLGVGKSTGDGKLATRPVITALIAAQVDALRHEPAIDARRIGLIGHSEGAELAPLAAVADAGLRVLVLMASPGRPIDAILLEQAQTLFRKQGMSEADLEKELDKRRAIFDAWRKGQPLPDSVPAGERPAWAAAEAWVKSYLDVDPAETARKLSKPAVLLAQGELDQQVSPTDARLLEKAFRSGGNRKVVLKLYPELNHLFAKTRTGDISEYTDADAHVDDAFVADVVTFVKKYL
jgi:fermentation-respiration switch protein FrsA (DUF1100 family)